MKRAFFVSLLIVSLAANLAVAATLAWHLWLNKGFGTATGAVSTELRPDQVRLIRNMWSAERRHMMMETRDKIFEKKAEILSAIANDPENFKALEPSVNDLLVLQGNVERQALERVSQVMATLPKEKRSDLLIFLQTRACMGRGAACGRGMGPGMGMGPRMRCGWGDQSVGSGGARKTGQGPLK